MAKLPKPSLGFALSATLLPLIGFSYVSASHARIGGHWDEALIDGGTFDSEPKLDSSEHPGLEVNRQSAPVGCGFHNLDIGQSVTIQSQNYPAEHPIRYSCDWFFQGTSRDSIISMTCNDFQLQGNDYGCLILKGGGLKTKSCNRVRRFKVKSDDDRLEVSFSTKGKAGSGFQCTVTALGNANMEDTWIGLNDQVTENDFTWISDGSALEDWQEDDWWQSYEPDNYDGNENCVEIDDGYLMNDEYCDDRNPYVCEMNL